MTAISAARSDWCGQCDRGEFLLRIVRHKALFDGRRIQGYRFIAAAEGFGMVHGGYQGTSPSSSKNRPVGPSSGRVASRIAAIAPCAGVRTPRKPLRSVAQ